MPFVPGRIEFLGKHTDYCGGESIVCPIGRGFRFEFKPRGDLTVSLENRDTRERLGFDLRDPRPQAGWINYAITVGSRLRSNFGGMLVRGVDISFASDLPPAAGLSSSSALMIMVFRALAEANRLDETDTYRANIRDGLELAEYLGCIENGRAFRGLAGSAGVGTFGGSQDHAAIVAGRAGHLSRFGFGPLRRISEFAFPVDHRLVVASSGVVAEKTGAAMERYNRVSRMVAEVERLVRTGSFEYPASDLLRRVRQFYEESFEIIPAAAKLIETGRIAEIGELLDRSQRNAESMLENQVAETVFLQRSARSLGAAASSAFGAGFGGSVYALVRSPQADAFLQNWSDEYRARFPDRSPEFFAADRRPTDSPAN